MSLHLELERRIAAFKQVEACVVFQSGFAANAGTVSAILGPEDHVVSDELNHASIIDGLPAVAGKDPCVPASRHAHAEEKLQALTGVPGHKLADHRRCVLNGRRYLGRWRN